MFAVYVTPLMTSSVGNLMKNTVCPVMLDPIPQAITGVASERSERSERVCACERSERVQAKRSERESERVSEQSACVQYSVV